jgi:hypothetical protein
LIRLKSILQHVKKQFCSLIRIATLRIPCNQQCPDDNRPLEQSIKHPARRHQIPILREHVNQSATHRDISTPETQFEHQTKNRATSRVEELGEKAGLGRGAQRERVRQETLLERLAEQAERLGLRAVSRQAGRHCRPGDEVPQANGHSVEHAARGDHGAALGVEREERVGDDGVGVEE